MLLLHITSTQFHVSHVGISDLKKLTIYEGLLVMLMPTGGTCLYICIYNGHILNMQECMTLVEEIYENLMVS